MSHACACLRKHTERAFRFLPLPFWKIVNVRENEEKEMALLSIPRCSLHWFVFGRDKNAFLWAAELDLELLPVCHGCQLKDTYQLRACGRTIIFQTNLRVKRTLRKSKSRVCKTRWSKGESMAAINVEKDGKRAQRDPAGLGVLWCYVCACVRVCARAYTYTHMSRCLCVLY